MHLKLKLYHIKKYFYSKKIIIILLTQCSLAYNFYNFIILATARIEKLKSKLINYKEIQIKSCNLLFSMFTFLVFISNFIHTNNNYHQINKAKLLSKH